jgi:hypothetical protein
MKNTNIKEQVADSIGAQIVQDTKTPFEIYVEKMNHLLEVHTSYIVENMKNYENNK